MIKNENYFQVSGWMLNVLEISGNDLLCFAIIYGFTQDGETSFSGSLKYLYEFMGSSKSTVMRSLDRLEERGFILKESQLINGVKFNRYRANIEYIDQLKGVTPPVSNWNRGGINLEPGQCQNDTGGGVKMKPNNIVYNKEDNKNENKEPDGFFKNEISFPPEAKQSTLAPGAKPNPGIVYPFSSDEFKKAWADWIEYKWSQHKDKYKELKTEQNALNQLMIKANHLEAAAISIVYSSMGNLYKGLFGSGQPFPTKNTPQNNFKLPSPDNMTKEQLAAAYNYNPALNGKKDI